DGSRVGAASLQQRSHAAPSRCDRDQGQPRSTRNSAPRSSWLAWRQNSQGAEQHHSDAAAAARARTQWPGKHLAVHAAELALKSDLKIMRRYRGALLLRLKHPHRSALENHVYRAPRLDNHGSLNVSIGISQMSGAKREVG